MCLTLVVFLSPRADGGPALVGPALAGAAGISVYLLALSAASQSKGLLRLRALHGERIGLSTAGLCGTRRLGKVVGPVAGADSGRTAAVGDDDNGIVCFVEIGAGLGAFSECSPWQLQSVASLVVVADVGTLSRSSSVALSAVSSVLIVWTVSTLSSVDVRFREDLLGKGAVRGGLAMDGDAGLMDLRKSM